MRRFKSKPFRSALLAHRTLTDGHLAGGKRRGRGPALLDVLVGLRFLFFLVAAHLTLGHGVSPLRPVERLARSKNSKSADVCMRGVRAPHSAVMPRLDRGIQYAAASRLIAAVSGILDRPVIGERKRRRPSDGYAGRRRCEGKASQGNTRARRQLMTRTGEFAS